MVRALVSLSLVAGCAPEGAPEATPAAAEDWALPDLGHPLAPPGVPLELTVGAAVSGAPLELTVRDADPGETVVVFASQGPIGTGPCLSRLGGLCLDLGAPISVVASRVADANGTASIVRPLPAGLSLGTTLTFQAVARRGVSGVDSVSSAPVERVVEPLVWSSAIAVDASAAEWTADELFGNTSGVGLSGVTWDADALYVLFEHPDVGASAQHWMHVYLSDGDGFGAASGVPHNTQEPALPFPADHLVRLKADGTYDSLESWDGSAWVGTPYWLGTAGSELAWSAADDVVELRIPRSLIGSDLVEIHLSWAYETPFFESTYAGVPQGSFVDGYDPDFGAFLTLDLTSPDGPVAQNP